MPISLKDDSEVAGGRYNRVQMIRFLAHPTRHVHELRRRLFPGTTDIDALVVLALRDHVQAVVLAYEVGLIEPGNRTPMDA